MHFIPIQDFFLQKYAHKKEKIFDSKVFTKNMHIICARSSNCGVSAKFFPVLVKTPYFGGVIHPKTYLNHELGYNFFS